MEKNEMVQLEYYMRWSCHNLQKYFYISTESDNAEHFNCGGYLKGHVIDDIGVDETWENGVKQMANCHGIKCTKGFKFNLVNKCVNKFLAKQLIKLTKNRKKKYVKVI